MNGLEEHLQRGWDMLIGREHGPFAFRFVLQPLVATALAVRAGLSDARLGRPPFGWTFVSDPTQRRGLAREGWRDIGRLFIAAIVIDVIYQIIVFRTVYPVQSLLVAAVLAIPAYFLIRGLTTRIAGGRGRHPGD
jgi:hypothetical protein